MFAAGQEGSLARSPRNLTWFLALHRDVDRRLGASPFERGGSASTVRGLREGAARAHDCSGPERFSPCAVLFRPPPSRISPVARNRRVRRL